MGLQVAGFLKAAKSTLFRVSSGLGLFWLAGHSPVRRNRLLILCYHGISMGEEHKYHPWMFLPAPAFEHRMQELKDSGAHVLALGDALDLLSRNKLPPRSVAITFDDGWADFRVSAYPVLQRYAFPATVYLTTYYCLYNKPIFSFALGHMMGARRSEVIENDRFSFLPKQLDLRSAETRAGLVLQLEQYAKQQGLSGKAKNDLAAEVAYVLGYNYDNLAREKLFHLMTPEEVSAVARGGVDIQLHTHRHRTPLDREHFVKEVNENRKYIQEMTVSNNCVHFCYPSGANRPEFLPWLEEAGVASATTCVSAFAEKPTNRLLLPRLLDQYRISDTEFEAWVTGFAAMMPRRNQVSLDVAPEY